MKASEQFVLVVHVLFMSTVVLIFKSVDETLCEAIQMKAVEQYFHVVLFIMLYKVVLTF